MGMQAGNLQNLRTVVLTLAVDRATDDVRLHQLKTML
jgi:hypothetical protein